jgi:hypothetical protein
MSQKQKFGGDNLVLQSFYSTLFPIFFFCNFLFLTTATTAVITVAL